MVADPDSSQRFPVDDANAGSRLDAFVAARIGVGRRSAARLIERARVNGRRAPKGHVLAAGDEVTLRDEQDVTDFVGPTLLRSEPDVLVLEKPSGLPTVAVAGRNEPSVAAWLRREHPECASVGKPGESGLVHRLDTGTSGLVVAARSNEAYAALRDQFRDHSIEKQYLAVVEGEVSELLEIDASIGQHRKSRTRVRALGPGPHPRYAVTEALTRVLPLAALPGATLISAGTTTGARHQIRVHLAHAGHPLVGDTRYGAEPAQDFEYLLHASELRWADPASSAAREAHSPMPAAWQQLVPALVPD